MPFYRLPSTVYRSQPDPWGAFDRIVKRPPPPPPPPPEPAKPA